MKHEKERNEHITETKSTEVLGVVSGCQRLNIRKEASINSEVAAIVAAGDELKITMDASDNDWCAVCTPAGVEGFCMKNYVSVKQ